MAGPLDMRTIVSYVCDQMNRFYLRDVCGEVAKWFHVNFQRFSKFFIFKAIFMGYRTNKRYLNRWNQNKIRVAKELKN